MTTKYTRIAEVIEYYGVNNIVVTNVNRYEPLLQFCISKRQYEEDGQIFLKQVETLAWKKETQGTFDQNVNSGKYNLFLVTPDGLTPIHYTI